VELGRGPAEASKQRCSSKIRCFVLRNFLTRHWHRSPNGRKVGIAKMVVLELDRKIDIGRDRTRHRAH
jgi:hypothetical protein